MFSIIPDLYTSQINILVSLFRYFWQHRVATILDSDSILTLSDGEIVEYDTPENLLADQSSIFASLVNSNQ